VLNVGDAVEANGEKGTVKLPKAPGNTVGVMIRGDLEMVQREDVKIVEEGMFGLTAIPDLRRMQALAGIASGEDGAMPASAGMVQPEPDLSGMAGLTAMPGTSTTTSTDECGSAALALLDQLASMLPNLRLADIKSIRKRVNDIMMQMNESVGFAGRQAVAEGHRRRIG
jgi:hypothetical protein